MTHEQTNFEAEKEPAIEPRVWIGSLVDYNEGILHGEWLDAAVEPEQLQQDVAGLLATSPTARATGLPAEEWGIFDYEGFGLHKVHEYAQLADVARIACAISEHGEAVTGWLDLHDGDLDVLDKYQEAFLGRFDSEYAWAESYCDDIGVQAELDRVVPEWLRPYVTVDYAQWSRDVQLEGAISVVEAPGGGVWIYDGLV